MKSVVVLMDARHGCWRMLRSAIEQVQITLTNQLAAVWALKPEPFWEKQHVDCVKSRPDCKVGVADISNLTLRSININNDSFQIQYLSLAKLHKMVDLDQLPEELGGQLPYQHKQWVKNRLVSVNSARKHDGDYLKRCRATEVGDVQQEVAHDPQQSRRGAHAT